MIPFLLGRQRIGSNAQRVNSGSTSSSSNNRLKERGLGPRIKAYPRRQTQRFFGAMRFRRSAFRLWYVRTKPDALNRHLV